MLFDTPSTRAETLGFGSAPDRCIMNLYAFMKESADAGLDSEDLK